MAGRGSIRKRGQESWEIKIEGGRGLDGKRHSPTKTVKGTKRDAELALTRWLNEIDTGMDVKAENLSVRAFLDHWLANAGAQWSRNCRLNYEANCRRYIMPIIGDVPLQKLKPAHVEKMLVQLSKTVSKTSVEGKTLSHNTVKLIRTCLHTALEYAVRLELVGRNVVRGQPVPVAKDRKEVEILNDQQVHHLLDMLQARGNEDMLAVTWLALMSGARLGEITALDWQDIDFDAATLSITKKSERNGERTQPKSKNAIRTIPLAPICIAAMRNYRAWSAKTGLARGRGNVVKPEDPIFTSVRYGTAYCPGTLGMRWTMLNLLMMRQLGTPHRKFHAMRHTYASCLIAAGIDVVSTCKLMGHANPNITLTRYAHLFKTRDDRAPKALEELFGHRPLWAVPSA